MHFHPQWTPPKILSVVQTLCTSIMDIFLVNILCVRVIRTHIETHKYLCNPTLSGTFCVGTPLGLLHGYQALCVNAACDGNMAGGGGSFV